MILHACSCVLLWVMCFDITHILSNLRTNMTFKESDMYGLQRGILLFPCNDVPFSSLFSSLFHVSRPFSSSLFCLQWVTAASETLLRTAVESTSKILSMTRPCKWLTHNTLAIYNTTVLMYQVLLNIEHCQTVTVSHSKSEWMAVLHEDQGMNFKDLSQIKTRL